MSDDPNIAPVPTLSYFEESRAASHRTLTRLILLAGAVYGFSGTLERGAVFVRFWPATRHILINAVAFSPQNLSIAIITGQLILSACSSVGCVVVLVTARARIFTVLSQALLIVLAGSNIFLQLFDYTLMRQPGIQPLVLATITVQMIGAFLQASLVPLLIIVVLLRRDLRPR